MCHENKKRPLWHYSSQHHPSNVNLSPAVVRHLWFSISQSIKCPCPFNWVIHHTACFVLWVHLQCIMALYTVSYSIFHVFYHCILWHHEMYLKYQVWKCIMLSICWRILAYGKVANTRVYYHNQNAHRLYSYEITYMYTSKHEC